MFFIIYILGFQFFCVFKYLRNPYLIKLFQVFVISLNAGRYPRPHQIVYSDIQNSFSVSIAQSIICTLTKDRLDLSGGVMTISAVCLRG